ncbi:MAG: hypothetical protein ACI9G1_000753 [Pirellulaceae bacterium]
MATASLIDLSYSIRWVRDNVAKKSGFQFGILSILIFTAGVAVILAVVQRLQLPALFYGIIAVYLAGFFGWAVFRLPSLFGDWNEHLAWRRDLHARRQQMICELNENKKKTIENSQDPV